MRINFIQNKKFKIGLFVLMTISLIIFGLFILNFKKPEKTEAKINNPKIISASVEPDKPKFEDSSQEFLLIQVGDKYIKAHPEEKSLESGDPVETRYFRSDSHTVNGLSARQLGTTQSTVSAVTTDYISYLYYYCQNCMAVWKRSQTGVETPLTSGYTACVVRTSSGSGIQSATWHAPSTPLAPTDAIVVRVRTYGRNTYRYTTFITEQLGAGQLSSATWTIYYYTSAYWTGSRTYCQFLYGSASYNSRIENFSYLPSPPTVSTLAATGITASSATLNGQITATGGQNADLRGFDGRMVGEPTWTEWCLEGTSGSYLYGTGPFSCLKTGLSAHTDYEFRAKAHNEGGWGYGGIVSFTTLNTTPTITSISDSPDPQAGGLSVNFTSIAGDADGDNIWLYVCKYADCSNCAPGNTADCWAVSATGAASDPTASYTCPSCQVFTYNYWAKVCDEVNACSSIISGGSFTCKKENGCPEVDPLNCFSGFAADGYCCNNDCTASCWACDLLGSVGTCTAVTAETGKGCTADCYDCVGGVCTAMTEDNDGNCNQGCTRCSSGSCIVRSPDDNVECPSGFRCDGVHPDCQVSICGVYTGPFDISTPGVNYVRYLSRDVVGNQESLKWKAINIFSNLPPQAQNLSAATSGSSLCCGITGYPPVRLSWQFSDPDAGDSQSAYQVQIATDSGFSSIVVDTGQVFSPSNSYTITTLPWATTFYWRVRVWDTQGPVQSDCGFPGGWCYPSPPTFTTISHPYPVVDFDFYPPSPAPGEYVQFCSIYEEGVCSDTAPAYSQRSKCYRGVGNGNFGYCTSTLGETFSWTITQGSGTFDPTRGPTHPNPRIAFSGTAVSLTVTDSSGYSCSHGEPIGVSLPLPKWKEIKPF